MPPSAPQIPIFRDGRKRARRAARPFSTSLSGGQFWTPFSGAPHSAALFRGSVRTPKPNDRPHKCAQIFNTHPRNGLRGWGGALVENLRGASGFHSVSSRVRIWALARAVAAAPVFRGVTAAAVCRMCVPRLKRRGGDSIVIRLVALLCAVAGTRALTLASSLVRPWEVVPRARSEALAPRGQGWACGHEVESLHTAFSACVLSGFRPFQGARKVPPRFPKRERARFLAPLVLPFFHLFTSSVSNTSRPWHPARPLRRPRRVVLSVFPRFNLFTCRGATFPARLWSPPFWVRSLSGRLTRFW